MGSRDLPPLRSFPRAFVPGISDRDETISLPPEELKKFRNVLRLGTGDRVVLLPDDGRALLCRLEGNVVIAEETFYPETDSNLKLTLALGIPKPDSLESSVRMATELGVHRFCLFTADRTVVKWDTAKWEKRLVRLEAIAREAAEVCFRTRLPKFEVFANLDDVLGSYPEAVVMSESDKVFWRFAGFEREGVIVVGPEGGWSPKEVELIGERAVTLGPRVFRVDTAVAAACSLALCDR